MGRTLTSHKEDGTSKPIRWLSSSNKSGHPVFRGTSALDRGTLKRKSGRNTIHFTADSGNIELMLRTIHSANQLSIDGAVSNWCVDLAEKMHDQTSTGVDRSISEGNDEISKQLDPQKVGSLVRNQLKTEGVAENCWRDHLQRFEMMNPDEQLRTLCEEGGLLRMYYRTDDDVNDGFENLIASCWECTLLRIHLNSEVKLWRHKYIEIGPVRDVKVICHHGRHGIEIEIPSTSGDNTNVWVVTPRCPNCCVDVSRYRDPEHSPEEAGHECMQDTDQEQPSIQFEMSDDHIPIHERKWKDIIANEFCQRYTWESQSRKLLVNEYDVKVSRQRTGWSNSLEIESSAAHNYIPKGWKPWVHWQRLDQFFGEEAKKQIPVLSEFSQQTIVHPSFARSHRRHDWTWDDGLPSHTLNGKQFRIPLRMFVHFEVHIGCMTHRRGARGSWKQTYSSLHSTTPMEWRNWRRISVTWRSPEKFVTKQGGNTLKTLFIGSMLGRHKRKCVLAKWNRMQSYHTALCHQIVSRDWSHNAETLTLNQRSSPRLAPRIVLKSTWHEQQQQQQQGDWRSCGNYSGTGTKVTTTMFQELRKTAANNVVEEDDSFQVGLRVHGVSQDVIHKDEERITNNTNFGWQAPTWISYQVHHERLETRRFYQRDQRNIKAQNQRNGQYWVVRTWRNSQSNSVSFVLALFKRRDSLLLVRSAGTNREHQASNWRHLRSSVRRQTRNTWRTLWTWRVAVSSLESQRCHNECWEKRDTQPSRKEGRMIIQIEKLNRKMDGLSSTAFSWTTSIQSKSSTRRPGDERNRYKNQLVLRWKDEKNPGKHVNPRWFHQGSQISCHGLIDTRKEWWMLISHQVAGSDEGRSTSSYVRISDGNVKIGDKFIYRRRHLHPRQLGGGTRTMARTTPMV